MALADSDQQNVDKIAKAASKMSRSDFLRLLAVLGGASILGTGVLCYELGATATRLRTTSCGAAIEPASYVIFIDGSTIRAVNGTTGAIDYSGSNPTAAIQTAINNLPISGGRITLRSGIYALGSVGLIIPNDRDVAIIGEGVKGTIIGYTGSDFAMKTNGSFNTPSQYNPSFTLGDMTIKCFGTSYKGAIDATNLDLQTEGHMLLWAVPTGEIPLPGSVGLILKPNQNALASFFPDLGIGKFDIGLILDRDHCTFANLGFASNYTYDLYIGQDNPPIDTTFDNLHMYHTAVPPTTIPIYYNHVWCNNISIHQLHTEGLFTSGIITNQAYPCVTPGMIIIDSWRDSYYCEITQVNQDSNAGTNVLYLSHVGNFYVGQNVEIGKGTLRYEVGTIASIDTVTPSITVVNNLTYTHTAALKDYVHQQLVGGPYWYGVIVKNFKYVNPSGSVTPRPPLPDTNTPVQNIWPWPIRLLTAGGSGFKFRDNFGNPETNVAALPDILMPGEAVSWATTPPTSIRFLPLNCW